MIGGPQQFALVRSQLETAADAQIGWRSLMGITFPARTSVDAPQEAAAAGGLGRSSALSPAASAYREAVEAALDHAAATRALELVDRELSATRYRLRALENRWVPKLEQTLHDVELSLAEQEREDMVRARWVANRDKRTVR